MTIVPASEIPTVSLLYHLKKLVPAEKFPDDIIPEASKSLNDKIGLIRGDITKLEVDAIVNAANNSLLGGGGVDGAIHRAAGRDLLRECRTLDGCDTGSAKITDGYELPSKKVIHAVGPVYTLSRREECEQDLRGCYTTSLKLAVENDCKTIAFSALSTGVYGYPSHAAAPVAIKAVKDFLESSDGEKLGKVVFTTFVQKDVAAYDLWLPRFFPSHETEVGEEAAPIDEVLPTKDDGEWEEVEPGESAFNGTKSVSKDAVDNNESKEEGKQAVGEEVTQPETPVLPDVPQVEPGDDGPSPKKQKGNDD